MKVIKFIRPNSPYNEGELAGFDDKCADRYVKAKVAVYVEQVKPETTKEPEKEPEKPTGGGRSGNRKK